MAPENTVLIIGGGFSGSLTAVQLIKQTEIPVNIILVNNGYPLPKGVAYSTESDVHLLNVRSARMSALPQEPMHFRRWLENQPDSAQYVQPGETLAEAFMPRRLYGQYLSEIVADCRKNLPEGVTFEIRNNEIVAIEQEGNYYQAETATGEIIAANKIILAPGNFEPAVLPGISPEVLNSNLYFNNPWKVEAMADIKATETVFLIGTGLTMIDTVQSLLEQNYTGKIIAISTNGRLPVTHNRSTPYPDISNELQPPYNLNKVYAAVKKHIKLAMRSGSSCEALIDAMRPQTQQIWQGLSLEDKRRFLRHLSSLWSIFRHRIAPQVAAKIQALQQTGQLEIRAARFIKAELSSNQVAIQIQPRKSKETVTILAGRMINCTGPQTNYSRIPQPLVKNLLRKNLLATDELGLGLAALPDGRLTNSEGKIIPDFFAIGPALRSVLWECTAVPEISEETQKLAAIILKEMKAEINTKVRAANHQPTP